jgi:hypothetical protein
MPRREIEVAMWETALYNFFLLLVEFVGLGVTPPNDNNMFGGVTMLRANNKTKTIGI